MRAFAQKTSCCKLMKDAKLARTAEPTFRPIVVHDWIARAARVWLSVHVENPVAPALTLRGDKAQLEDAGLLQLGLRVQRRVHGPPGEQRGLSSAPSPGLPSILETRNQGARGRSLARSSTCSKHQNAR